MPSPSKSQLQAITHGEGPMLVLAGPGSGKTYVMIQRVQYLISHFHIDPTSILVISFSRASAEELRQRFYRQTGQTQSKVNFSTFHACFFHILKSIYHYTSKDIISPKEQHDIMKILLTDPRFDEIDTVQTREEYIQKFSYYKNRGLVVMRENEPPGFQELFSAYQSMMHSHHKLDFDDMGLLCLKLFQEKPEVLARWQRQFQYILIDEFQDINPIQFSIVSLLAEKRKNLFVVGDDDQAIYSFRGASPRIMQSFESIYPGAAKVLLETNFRCSKNIVEKSLEIIEKNRQRFDKAIVSHHGSKAPVRIKCFEQSVDEYAYITKSIQKLADEGTEYREIACIYRTNQNMMGLADYFIRHRIPFTMKEQGASIFQHFIAKDILAYLSFFKEGRKRGEFFRVMNKPLRYFSRSCCTNEVVSWQELRFYYRSKPYMQEIISSMEKQEKWIKKLDLYGALSYIRKIVGYEQYAMEEAKTKGISSQEVTDILDFIQNSLRGVKTLEEYRIQIAEYEEALARAKDQEKNGVQLITMHACKGLEYEVVFLPDCNEGKVPHKRAQKAEEIEEERRMFYVAMTRAKEKLEILYLQDRFKKRLHPSRFIAPDNEPVKKKGEE